jgi:hypothetical protein
MSLIREVFYIFAIVFFTPLKWGVAPVHLCMSVLVVAVGLRFSVWFLSKFADDEEEQP